MQLKEPGAEARPHGHPVQIPFPLAGHTSAAVDERRRRAGANRPGRGAVYKVLFIGAANLLVLMGLDTFGFARFLGRAYGYAHWPEEYRRHAHTRQCRDEGEFLRWRWH